MGLRRGACEMGLKVTWKYEFIGPGTSLISRADTVALDVGNRLAPGVLDQHHSRELGPSTSRLVMTYPELIFEHLLTQWHERADGGQSLDGREWSPIITTHRAPDFDGIVSTLLVQELIEHGEFPRWADGLAKFAAKVDQGKFRIDIHALHEERPPVSCAFYALEKAIEDPSNKWIPDPERMRLGLQLIRAELRHLEEKKGEDRWSAELFEGAYAGGWTLGEEGERIGKAINDDYKKFQEEWIQLAPGLKEAELPLHGTLGTWHPLLAPGVKVKAVVLDKPPKSFMFKDWVRAKGVPMTIIPWPERPPKGNRSRLLISLDPNGNYPEGRPTLRGLGAALECHEHFQRRKGLEGDSRGGVPRWPGAFNDDPWYSGRGHEYTIVDAPRDWSVLTRDKIIRMALTRQLWRLPKESALQWSVQAVRPIFLAQPKEGDHIVPSDLSGLLPGAQKALSTLLRLNEESIEKKAFWEEDRPADSTVVKREVFYWREAPDVCIERVEIAFNGKNMEGFLRWLWSRREKEGGKGLSFVLDAPVFQIPGVSGDEDELAHAVFLGASKQAEGESVISGAAGTISVVSGNVMRFPCAGQSPEEYLNEASTPRKKQWWRFTCDLQLLHCFYATLSEQLLLRASELHEQKQGQAERQKVTDQINRALVLFDVVSGSANAEIQLVYQRLRDQSDVSELTAKLRHEANALQDQIASGEEKNINFFLFLIGLMGLVEAVNGWEEIINDKMYLIGFVSAASVFTLGGMWIYRIWPFSAGSKRT